TEPERPARVPAGQESFFDLPDEAGATPDVTVLAAELAAQRAAVEGSAHPHRLRLLAAAESQGALVAAEIRAAGLPWDRGVHEALLAEQLGPRPAPGERPARLQALAERIADVLGSP
ncbi:bifunctional 3'-5' exonuclease/DNA polymerase, partial [Xanthomonas citri pv. citri]|nr:bifunctional 3'-5' exonuclease/DNA polymerase [Xanthomonas citri pv. citri]